jgi:hypothetical protein
MYQAAGSGFSFEDHHIPRRPGNGEAVPLAEPQKQFPVLDTFRVHKDSKGGITLNVRQLRHDGYFVPKILPGQILDVRTCRRYRGNAGGGHSPGKGIVIRQEALAVKLLSVGFNEQAG